MYPIIEAAKAIKKFSIIHVAIGGWLCEFLKTNNKFVKKISKFSIVLVQSESLRKSLVQDFHFNNVEYFPNFRVTDYVPIFKEALKFNIKHPLKIVFLARITMEKGIDVIFDIAHDIQKKHQI